MLPLFRHELLLIHRTSSIVSIVVIILALYILRSLFYWVCTMVYSMQSSDLFSCIYTYITCCCCCCCYNKNINFIIMEKEEGRGASTQTLPKHSQRQCLVVMIITAPHQPILKIYVSNLYIESYPIAPASCSSYLYQGLLAVRQS